MDITDIISRLEVVVDNIEYEDANVSDVYDALMLLINDIESSTNFDTDFGSIGFDEIG